MCLTGSVYCEEVTPDMTSVPALPKETAYLYARYNRIKKITAKDFADICKLGRLHDCYCSAALALQWPMGYSNRSLMIYRWYKHYQISSGSNKKIRPPKSILEKA